MDENLSRGYCQLLDEGQRGGDGQSRRPMRHSGPDQHSPVDRYNLIYVTLMMCGAGFLLPYNSFITAVDYYQDKYPGSTIIFDMSLTYICLALASVILNNLFVDLVPLQVRITFGYVLSFVTLLLISVLDISLKWFSPAVSYRMTLVAVAVVSMGCTVQQSSFYGYTSMLPSRYTQAVMVGESAAGLIVSVNRILTKALMPYNISMNTLIFFIISLIMVMLCCITFHLTRRTNFSRYHVSLCQNAGLADDQQSIVQSERPEEVSLVDILDSNVTNESYGVLVIHSPSTPPGEPNGQLVNPTTGTPAATDVIIRETVCANKGHGRSYKRNLNKWQGLKRGCIRRFKVAQYAWPYMLSIGLTYCITLCLFPGVESEIVSCTLHSWMPVLLISVFNLFDFIGKIVAATSYDWPKCKLVGLSCCRLVFVPLMMLCVTPRERPLVRGEFWPFLLSILLGISNGYFGSIPMIIAPGKVPDEHKEITGNIMTLSYSIGLTTGSAVAYLLDEWLGPHLADPCAVKNVTSVSLSTYRHALNETFLSYLLPLPPTGIL